MIDKGVEEPSWQDWEWATEEEVDNAPVKPKGLIKACKNNKYVVQFFSHFISEIGVVDRIIIKRNDGKAICPWRDKQRIKNEVCANGAKRFAVEVFPPADDLINDANCYHLWVFPAGYGLPYDLKKIGY
ncbi:MAG: hypothetical protein WA919_00790 [Coleofasciculaceae cyanobacterium]